MCQTSAARCRTAVAAGAILILWLCCPLAGGLARAQAPAEGPKRLALLVGVNEYKHDKLPALKYAVNDVTELGQVLGAAGYEVTLLSDDTGKKDEKFAPTKANIEKRLRELARRCQKGDTLVLALTGHGLQFGQQKDAYYCPLDARPFEDETATLVSITALYNELEKSYAGVKVVLVDACRNDPTPGRGRGLDADTAPAPPKGVGVLFSCSAGQRAFEHDSLKHGVFFYYLLEGLRKEAADRKGRVTFDDLQKYVRDEVPDRVRTLFPDQKPDQSPNVKGDFAGKPLVLLTLGTASLSKPFVATKAGDEWDGNGLKLKFCWCPPGKFTMGSPKDERGRHEEGEDQAEVTISRGFWLGKYELTQGQWQKSMGTTLRQQFDKARAGKRYYGSVESWVPPFDVEGANDPMSYVNHDEATEFCRKLAEQERQAGRLPADWDYRLPTEAQWEYACRAGTTTSSALKLSKETANYDWDWQPNGKSTGPPSRIKPVGSYQPNAWGLHDLHGNVDEWCRDWYALANNPRRPGTIAPLPGGIDPEVTEEHPSASLRRRVIRGGNYGHMTTSNRTRSAERGWAQPGLRALALGFRVALVQK